MSEKNGHHHHHHHHHHQSTEKQTLPTHTDSPFNFIFIVELRLNG